MKFPHIEFLGTDQEVLDFVGAKKFDYETDYSNASVNVRLFGSHGKCNVPLGYHFVKDSNGALSVLTDEIVSHITELEQKNKELQEESKKTFNDWLEACDKYGKVNLKLTKAIEFLKWALHSDPEHDDLVDFDTKWKEAEQFLRENDALKEKQEG